MNIVCLVLRVGYNNMHTILLIRYKFEYWDIGKDCHQIHQIFLSKITKLQ